MLIQILVLAIMDPLKGNIIICTDASDLTTGAVLMQDKKYLLTNIVNLNFGELNHPVYEKKLLAIIHSLKFRDITY